MSTTFANPSKPIPVDELLNTRGVVREAEGFVVGCAIARDSSRMAFATGEGIVHVTPRRGEAEHWRRLEVHDGAALALAQDVTPQGFLTGGDDNRLCRIDVDDVVHELGRGRRWVEHVASVVEGRTALIASAVGKQVELRDADGALARTLEHDSTVSGVVFDAKGKRIATSHYGGATLRFVNTKSDAPRVLAWKGSHIGIALHPNGEALVTAMQENELHGWRLPDGHNMRMSGYPQKTQSISFSRSGRWLATSGADAVVLWPFFGGGPMGKPPTELAGIQNVLCTRVAFHPQHDIVAAGFADGTVLMADVATRKVLPVCGPHGSAGNASVSALAYSPDGSCLAFGTEGGRMAVVDLSPR
nr:WD40 repeat domain-containing protein [uncultured Lichenicoccus sp.]